MPGRLSLRWRLTLIYTSLLAAFLLLLSFIAQASLERFLIDEELVHLKTQARPINKAIKDALPANRTYADLASDLAWQVAGPEVIVYLLDTQGHVLAASKGADALDPLAGDCYKRALARERDVSQIVHAMGSSAPRWLAYCHWVHVDELNFGVAYLAKSLARTDALLQEVQDLRQALEARKIIERAKGILMRRLNLTEEEAFRRLQKRSQDESRKLIEVAQAVIMADQLL